MGRWNAEKIVRLDVCRLLAQHTLSHQPKHCRHRRRSRVLPTPTHPASPHSLLSLSPRLTFVRVNSGTNSGMITSSPDRLIAVAILTRFVASQTKSSSLYDCDAHSLVIGLGKREKRLRHRPEIIKRQCRQQQQQQQQIAVAAGVFSSACSNTNGNVAVNSLVRLQRATSYLQQR